MQDQALVGMPHRAGHQLAGADDVDEPQPGQVEVDGARVHGQSGQRLAELVLSGHVGFTVETQSHAIGQ